MFNEFLKEKYRLVYQFGRAGSLRHKGRLFPEPPPINSLGALGAGRRQREPFRAALAPRR